MDRTLRAIPPKAKRQNYRFAFRLGKARLGQAKLLIVALGRLWENVHSSAHH
jgi:hypothetical protein